MPAGDAGFKLDAPPRPGYNGSMPHMSVVIPTYNSADDIRQCLEAVRASSYKDYELIVVDDGSRDESVSIAERYADKVLRHKENRGVSLARQTGSDNSAGEIIVNIADDIIISPDTLHKIDSFFSENPDTAAVVGILSKESPAGGFFGRYKNLYMNYIFSRLAREITFIYGSIHARRRSVHFPYEKMVHPYTEDTEMGQYLVSIGRKIAFMPELEVIHLKKYSLFSFIRNDFRVPYNWADIFLKNKGWRQFGKKSSGFAHSPKWQLASVALAPLVTASVFAALFFGASFTIAPALFALWLMLNGRFLLFLFREAGAAFGICGIAVTFIDNIVMACGIFCGFIASICNSLVKKGAR